MCQVDQRTRIAPGWIHNLWWAPPGPADNAASSDSVGHGGIVPLAAEPGGSLFRLCLVPPQAYIKSLTDAEIEHTFAKLDASAARKRGAGHRLMHATETVDYVVVLRGSVTLHLDAGSVHLGPMDTLVQRGTSHGWSNESDEWAVLAVAMVGALPFHGRWQP